MPLNLLKYFFIFTLLLFSACGETPANYAPLSANATILAFGDSLTFGKGADSQHSYPAVLQKLSQKNVVNAGISGEVSARGLQRLPALLSRHQPELVIICHGGNDILRGLNLKNTKSNILQMINLAKSAKAKVLMIAVPKPSIRLSALPFYQEIADTTDIIYDPESMITALGTRQYKSDTYHPNAAGYTFIAEQIHQQLITSGLLKEL